MKRDKYKTDVIFRLITINGISEITALFPHEVETLEGCVCCYAHVGQHGIANYTYCVSKGRLATKKESKNLKKELRFIGYNLNEIKKQNRKKYIASLQKLKEKAFPK